MAWAFADGFDLYSATLNGADMAGYWDTVSPGSFVLTAGRFPGGRCLGNNGASPWLAKSSNVNDAVHHIVCAFEQTNALAGASMSMYLTLVDAATAQCSIVFRSDGAILLTLGGPTGTVLATYAGAVAAASVWYGFEFEVVIGSGTSGSFAVRKNGNTANDFTATGLNTQNSANAYANRLSLGMNVSTNQNIDDLFWQSGAATGAWLGDLRCYTRMPATDAQKQFSPNLTSTTQTPFTLNTTSTVATVSRYGPVTPLFPGAVSTVSVSMAVGFTGNMKCAIFASAAGHPGAVIQSAAPIVNPVAGNNVFTFSPPVTVQKGTQYFIGIMPDVSGGTFNLGTANNSGFVATTTYAAFPVASPSVSTDYSMIFSWTIAIAGNYPLVSEAQEDGLTTYVQDSTVGDADFYGTTPLALSPATVIATVVRGYLTKADAGSAAAVMQIKSGATTVATPRAAPATNVFQWAWRTDLVDPNTGAAWSSAAVDNVQFGPQVVA
jgi:hypothetical protein